MAQPSTRSELITYAKRQLGAPVLEINVADEQVEDLLDDAIQYFQERHFDGVYPSFLKYKITDDMLKYREGCDVIMRKTGPKIFFGGTSTCECWVTWNGIKTYVQNEVMLSETEYQVTDKGLHAENHSKVWGSDYGAFKFVRQ